jgi:hypothetical protein
MTEYLDLADLLVIAEILLDVPAEDLAKASRLDLAESALHAPGASYEGVESRAVGAELHGHTAGLTAQGPES